MKKYIASKLNKLENKEKAKLKPLENKIIKNTSLMKNKNSSKILKKVTSAGAAKFSKKNILKKIGFD